MRDLPCLFGIVDALSVRSRLSNPRKSGVSGRVYNLVIDSKLRGCNLVAL